jgi:SAM-dependent methyltransferase
MERRNPKRFPRDDRLVYDAYIAGRQSAALAAAVRLGLFDALASGPLEVAALCARLDARERPLRSLLAALVAMKLLDQSGGAVRLAPEAADYLVRGKPGWLGGLIDLEIEHFLDPRLLLDAMRRDDASVYGGEDPWEAHEADPERARRFTAAMHSVSERPAAGLAEVVDFSRVSRLLDVGGGSGALSLAIARAWPNVRCTIWDLPVVCGIAREYAAAAGLAERVTAEPGDMFRDPFPSGHDAVLFSQILHDWAEERWPGLLAKAAAALPEGGLLLVHEKLVEDDGRGPLANALVNLDMLVWTEGRQLAPGEVRRLLSDAGFRDVERRATAGYWSVVIGRRRGGPTAA